MSGSSGTASPSPHAECPGGSGRGWFAVPELFRGVALDPLSVLAHFALGAFFVPSEVFGRNLRGGFYHLEGDPRAVAGHRAPQEHVGERLGHLLAESPDHLGPYKRSLDALDRGERREE